MKKIYFLFPIVMLLLLSACRKDVDIIGETTTTTTPPIIENYNPEVKPVTSSVEGQVQDVNKDPVQNATVRLGNLTTMTDKYGLFSFENVTMNEKGTFITVTQDRFIDGSRRFFPKEDVTSKVVIEMIPEDVRTAFDASTGGTITINGTTGVAFPPNSIANANGEVFEGEVFASYAYLDPTANSTADRMPGNLQGVQTDLEEVALQSFGMINVSLEDADGAPLNILEGSTATVTVAIPASIAANAPNEMPLWSFNEVYGIWVEEGSATKVNGHYVGEVSHFSWWNCDYPYPLVELDITLVDENDNPVSNHIVALGLGSDSIACYYSYTNGNGFTSGKVPASEVLLLQIRGLCDEIIYSEEIGPYSENTSLTISVEDSNVNDTEITGSLIDCDGNPVTNGGVIVEVGDVQYIRQVSDGTFNFFISTCDGATDLTVTGLDLDAQLGSDPPVNGTIGTVVNTGPIEVCDIVITTSTLTVRVGDELYNYFGDGLTGGESPNGTINIQYFPLDSIGGETWISLQANGTTAGNYDDNNTCNMYDDGFSSGLPPYNLRSLDANAQGINFANFNISQIDPNLVGTFSDTLINSDFSGNVDTVFVSGSFTIIQ